ncbi:adenosine kinase [Candidatus Micrarchaeota archaeon]|nr:adenosine kinase [Candidatus Micrarchaeota archaeon]
MNFDVFSIGTALVDYFVEADDSFLKANKLAKGATNFMEAEKLNELQEKVKGRIIAKFPGDNGRNVCEGVSFLGGGAAYASNVADDADGNFFLKELGEQKISSFVNVEEGRTGRIIAFITPDKQRTFAANLGNGVDYASFEEDAIMNSNFLFTTSITLLCKGETSESTLKAVEFAKQNKVKTALSLESPPMIEKNKEELLEIITQDTTVLFANEEEANALMGGTSEYELMKLASLVTVFCFKRGEKGSQLYTRGSTYKIPAIETKVVDTTGAGDFYAAGVLKALSDGELLVDAGMKGAELAAKIVSRFGATLKE